MEASWAETRELLNTIASSGIGPTGTRLVRLGTEDPRWLTLTLPWPSRFDRSLTGEWLSSQQVRSRVAPRPERPWNTPAAGGCRATLETDLREAHNRRGVGCHPGRDPGEPLRAQPDRTTGHDRRGHDPGRITRRRRLGRAIATCRSAQRRRRDGLDRLNSRPMRNQTIAALEAVDSASAFERLCSTLLLPEYPNLVPIGGTADRGRDATAELFASTDAANRKVVLQFSYQADWRAKLSSELEKVKANGLDPARYVFVTNRRVSGQARAGYEESVPRDYGWAIELYDQEWLRARLESPEYLHLRSQYLGLPPEAVPLFLSPENFAARAGRADLARLDVPLVGREGELQRLAAWLDDDAPVLVLFGPGGLGKTKLALGFAERIAADGRWRPVFVRTDAEAFEPHLAELAPGQAYLVIVDDAERWRHGQQLVELLANPSLGLIKLLLVTRPVFADRVAAFATRFRIDELALQPMRRADLDRVITGRPFYVRAIRARNIVLDLAQGHPLVAQAAAGLLNSAGTLHGLTRDDVLRRYFDHLVEEAIGRGPSPSHNFLAVLAGLGNLELGARTLREAVREQLGIDEAEEERIIRQLVRSGVVRQGVDRLRIVPDTLAEHLLLTWFFDPDAPYCYDFRRFVLEPFLPFKAADVVRNLAAAEALDDTTGAGPLLSSVLDTLADLVAEGDNVRRLAVLQAIAESAAWRPDDALYVVDKVIFGEERPPASFDHPVFGRTEVDHADVLLQAVRVLEQTAFRAVAASLDRLHQLARHGGADDAHRHLREEATKALAGNFKLEPDRPWSAYDAALGQVERWLAEEPEGSDLIVDLLGELLEVRVVEVDRSPDRARTVVWREDLLRPTPELRALRDRVLRLLHGFYERTTSPRLRKRIIEAHDPLAVFLPRKPDPPLQAFVDVDVDASIAFFAAWLDAGAELYERLAIWEWVQGIRRHGGHAGDGLGSLIVRIERSPQHQRYLYLVGYPYRYTKRSERKARERDQARFRGRLVARADERSIDQWVDDLEEIVARHRRSGGISTHEVALLLQALARWKPTLVEHVLHRAGADQLHLRHDVAAALAVVRGSRRDAALRIATDWVGSEDPVLHRAVAASYRWPPEPVTDEDLPLLERIAQTEDRDTLGAVVRTLPRFQRVDRSRALGLLKGIAARADDLLLVGVAEVLADDEFDPRGDWHFVDVDPDELRELVWNFMRMKALNAFGNHEIETALGRLGRVDPHGLLRFLRGRIEQVGALDQPDPDYRALPYQLHEAVNGLDRHPDFTDLLREARDWALEAGGKRTARTMEGIRVLKQLAQGRLDGPLRIVLGEWVEGSIEQQRAAAHILREFADQPACYGVAKELLVRTDDEVVQAHLSGATLTVSTGTFGTLVPGIEERKRAYQAWLDDPMAPTGARRFARRMIERLGALMGAEERILAGDDG